MCIFKLFAYFDGPIVNVHNNTSANKQTTESLKSCSSHRIRENLLLKPIKLCRYPRLNALRLWMSLDGYISNPQHYSSQLSSVLALGDKHGIKFIITLFNWWHSVPDWGGYTLLSSRYACTGIRYVCTCVCAATKCMIARARSFLHIIAIVTLAITIIHVAKPCRELVLKFSEMH